MIDDAAAYAAGGWPIFPCKGDKSPLTERGYMDASTDLDQVKQWWSRWPTALIGAPTGINFDVLDVDPRYRGDRHLEELVERLGPLPAGWRARTPGGGHHHFFAPNPAAPNGSNRFRHLFEGSMEVTGLDVKAAGGYVVVAPSSTPAGAYVWERGPGGIELPAWPDWALTRPEPAREPEDWTGGEKIAHGTQHDVLVRFAGLLRGRGAQEAEILAFLLKLNERCELPGPEGNIRQIAASAMQWEPGEAAGWMSVNGGEPNTQTRGGPRFSVRRLRPEDIRAPRWAFDSWFLVGALNGLVGVGGAGKGTLMSHLVANWTRGSLPGHLQGGPANVLIVGDEDSASEVWAPRILAAGGDLAHVYMLAYDDGAALDLVRDIGVLERYVAEHNIQVVYVDQVLDHLGADLNAHVQKDVRRGLAPVRSLARRLERTVSFTAHPNKMGGAISLRDRAGGSGQFIDLPRSAMVLGWHPDRDGYRVLARGKGNVGAVPPALVFRIDIAFVTNPQSGEVVDVPVVADLQPEEGLAAEDVSPHPPRQKGPSAQFEFERVMYEVGADGGWHSRREAREACAKADVGASTFDHMFSEAEFVERTREGRETRWRLTE